MGQPSDSQETLTRLDILKPYLAKYSRTFTVLDIGAGINTPSIGDRIHQTFSNNAVVVEIEKNPGRESTDDRFRTMILRKDMSAEDLARLSECEHFDIVLAFNVLHWFDDWKAALDVILEMGDYVFIQIPNVDELMAPNAAALPEMTEYIRANADRIGEAAQHAGQPPRAIYSRGNGLKRITRTSWTAHANSADIVVYSTHKYIGYNNRKKRGNYKDWVCGMNLWNFVQLNGIWPPRKYITGLLREYHISGHHGDVTPWNIILDGTHIYLIDGHENWEFDDAEGVAKTIEMIL